MGVLGQVVKGSEVEERLVHANETSSTTSRLDRRIKTIPDLVRLLRRLAVAEAVPRSVRIGLVVLIGYLLLPIDLVPDFVPVLGYAEDASLIATSGFHWAPTRSPMGL
ncbi:MAG: YkvA family protein [Mycobacterium leprae]